MSHNSQHITQIKKRMADLYSEHRLKKTQGSLPSDPPLPPTSDARTWRRICLGSEESDMTVCESQPPTLSLVMQLDQVSLFHRAFVFSFASEEKKVTDKTMHWMGSFCLR
jgi:hypothetical protein